MRCLPLHISDEETEKTLAMSLYTSPFCELVRQQWIILLVQMYPKRDDQIDHLYSLLMTIETNIAKVSHMKILIFT